MPLTSSITIKLASFFLNIFSASLLTVNPKIIIIAVENITAAILFLIKKYKNTPAMLPKVPGINGRYPI
jgi:hypothetical protein